MSTNTLEFTELSELLDFEPVCDRFNDITRESCEQDAHWSALGKLECCTRTILMCDFHKDEMIEDWNTEIILICTKHQSKYWITWSQVIVGITLI